MTDKRKSIIEAGMELFSGQGFKNTSMQQIADRCNISKGAIYLHFSSKSELMAAIMEHLTDEVKQEIEAIRKDQSLTPRQRFKKQIAHQFSDVLEHQQLMAAFLTESEINLDEHLLLLVQKYRYDWQKLQEQFIHDVYGDQVLNYLTDLSVILNGVINEYYSFLILETVEIDIPHLAKVLVRLMDDAVGGMVKHGDKPVLTRDMLPDHHEIEKKIQAASLARVRDALDQLDEGLKALGLDADESEGAEASLGLIRSELDRQEPNKVLIQGMLANLREYKTLNKARTAIATELKIRLI